MKDFLVLVLTKLGLGKNACVGTTAGIVDNLHECFGNEFNAEVVNDSTIKISCNDKTFNLIYTIIPNSNVDDDMTQKGLINIVTDLVIAE